VLLNNQPDISSEDQHCLWSVIHVLNQLQCRNIAKLNNVANCNLTST